MASHRTIETTPATRIVCELDASTRAQAALDAAIARCKETGAELLVLWILHPQLLHTPYRSSGAPGAWGLPHVLHDAVVRARTAGVSATSAVRIGDREVILRQESAVAGTASIHPLAPERSVASLRRAPTTSAVPRPKPCRDGEPAAVSVLPAAVEHAAPRAPERRDRWN